MPRAMTVAAALAAAALAAAALIAPAAADASWTVPAELSGLDGVAPMTTGRNFDEVLRVLDSLQLTAKHKVATPAQWRPGEKVIVTSQVPDDEAREKFGEFEQPKPYIRIVPQPTS